MLWKVRQIMQWKCLSQCLMLCKCSVSVTILLLSHEAAFAWCWTEIGLLMNWRGPASAAWSYTKAPNPSCTGQPFKYLKTAFMFFLSLLQFKHLQSYHLVFMVSTSLLSLSFVHTCRWISKNTASRNKVKTANLIWPAWSAMGPCPCPGTCEQSNLSLMCVGVPPH